MSGLTQEAIERIATEHAVQPEIIKAIIKTESGDNEFAVRFEPLYRYVVDCHTNKPFRVLTQSEIASCSAPVGFTSHAGSASTEWVGQRTSWGPMQIMGAVARELGYKGFFPGLCGELGVEYGVAHFVRLFKRFYNDHGMPGVIAAYNAGSPRYQKGKGFANQEYVDKVIGYIPAKYQHEAWLK